jgi:ubiquinone/menaquinone biosynthesis C-methylase UbiE
MDGRARLEVGSAVALPFDDGVFDAVYATNTAQFWPDLATGMSEVHRVMRPGGRAVIVVQPMWRGATEADADRWVQKLSEAMRGATFSKVDEHKKRMRPLSAGAVVGRK